MSINKDKLHKVKPKDISKDECCVKGCNKKRIISTNGRELPRCYEHQTERMKKGK